jgi:hypothetical protein
MKHPTSFELQEYLDGLIDDKKRSEIEIHVGFCNDCDAALKSLRNLGAAISNIPQEKTSHNFTDGVMRQLGVKPSQSFAWKILRNLAPLFALLVLVGIIYWAMNVAGTLDSSGLGVSLKETQKVYSALDNGLTIATAKLNGSFKSIFAFLYVKGISGLTTFLVLFLCAVGILDKYVFMPLIRKKT